MTVGLGMTVEATVAENIGVAAKVVGNSMASGVKVFKATAFDGKP